MKKFLAWVLVIGVTFFIIGWLGGKNGEEHTHVFASEYSYDEANHWYACDCGEREDESTHELDNGLCDCGYINEELHTHVYGEVLLKDDVNHWKVCKCGQESTKASHDYIQGVCVCGHQETTHEHNHKWVKYDETYHWFECGCGEIKDKFAHRFEVGNQCVCGYVRP